MAMFKGKSNLSYDTPKNRNEIKANWMRMLLIFSFILGSMVASILFMRIQYWGFLIPTTISAILWCLSVYQNKDQPSEWQILKEHEQAS